MKRYNFFPALGGGGSIDPDAQVYIDALATAGFVDAALTTAWDAFIVGLKSDGTYSTDMRLWPMRGGTSARNAINAIDPGTNDLTFSGGWTHAASGATPNGSTGYATTGVSPDMYGPTGLVGLLFYSRTDAATASVEMGMDDGGSPTVIATSKIITKYSDNNAYSIQGTVASAAVVDSLGCFIASRESTSYNAVYQRGSLVASNAAGMVLTPNTNEIYIGAENNITNGVPGFFSAKECGFAGIIPGPDATDAASISARVQTFMTAIGHAV